MISFTEYIFNNEIFKYYENGKFSSKKASVGWYIKVFRQCCNSVLPGYPVERPPIIAILSAWGPPPGRGRKLVAQQQLEPAWNHTFNGILLKHPSPHMVMQI